MSCRVESAQIRLTALALFKFIINKKGEPSGSPYFIFLYYPFDVVVLSSSKVDSVISPPTDSQIRRATYG